MFSSWDGMCGIGELARRAEVSVKTVRFYSDRALLPEASRSSGGHRRYGPDALERLRLIRALRTLDLPVSTVHRVLDDEDENAAGRTGGALEDAVAGQLAELGTQLAALRWREAALRAVQESPKSDRPGRLLLIGAVTAPPNTAPLARFWRAWLPPRMPPRSVSAFLEAAVPQPPQCPEPAQVLAFARLYAMVTGPCDGDAPTQPHAHRSVGARGSAVLYAGLAEAYDLAAAQMRQGAEPHAGEALDGFVDAYARAANAPDTPDFRRALARRLAADPRLDRYWELTAELVSRHGDRPAPNPGTSHDWLLAALNSDPGRAAAARGACSARLQNERRSE
ncbi:MerR family transcriptional regulator [Streptomyces sp. B1I3]|uniref:MerR family transcriptional regulator n=1 Tax=Streptomyces sp. B1I3 TaxID=3042264 RepID=UPI0027861B45|nr:MerR family transcriptional regulator [Streptomyces sp. B1I3]MDQ0791769.1 DNA-binding transcriptional MerR regulator [Streptomyces sp. B1I3]